MKWYIKEFSQLTKVSERMLRYYDKIGLLKPSVRLPNDYRLYSETDLLKLQQIIALRFFGFNLKQIHLLNNNILENLLFQKKVLEEKQGQLQFALHTLDKVIDDFRVQQTVDWNNVVKLLREDYKMLIIWANNVSAKMPEQENSS